MRTRLWQALAAGPGRVLVIGAGFTGCEVASACRELGVPVTVAERGPAPLSGALGAVIGGVAAQMQRDHGVDLRCGVQVTALEGGGSGDGRLRRARLSDGSALDVDVAVAALGGIRNVEWLEGSGLAAGTWGVACDAGCRVFDVNGVVTDNVFVAGDVARFPHPVYGYQFLALEHWGNAVAQAQVAAHNMISAQGERWPHLALPEFWSTQFGTEIKSVGVPTHADQVVIAQGSVAERRFVAVYGYRGRVTAAVAFNQAKWLEFYAGLIDRAAPFPPSSRIVDEPADGHPVAAGFPDRLTPHATVVVTGHEPSERRVTRGAQDVPVTPRRVASVQRSRPMLGRSRIMSPQSLWQQILDYSSRADPYPLYAELRQTPVVRAEDGSYVVSTYREIVALLHDPRLSSDLRNLPDLGAGAACAGVRGKPSRAAPAASSRPTRPSTTGSGAC